MANGLLVLGGMGVLAAAFVAISLHKIEEGKSSANQYTLKRLELPCVASSLLLLQVTLVSTTG